MKRLFRRIRYFCPAQVVVYGLSTISTLFALLFNIANTDDNGMFMLGLSILFYLQAMDIGEHDPSILPRAAQDALEMVGEYVSLWTAAGWSDDECIEVMVYGQVRHGAEEHNSGEDVPPRPAILGG